MNIIKITQLHVTLRFNEKIHYQKAKVQKVTKKKITQNPNSQYT